MSANFEIFLSTNIFFSLLQQQTNKQTKPHTYQKYSKVVSSFLWKKICIIFTPDQCMYMKTLMNLSLVNWPYQLADK